MSVAKYSPAHTSVQWNAEASSMCRERAAAAALGGSGYMLRCESLDKSVDEATAHGDIPMSTRAEPKIRPLADIDVIDDAVGALR